MIKSSSFDEVSKVIDTALNLGTDNPLGYDYLADFDPSLPSGPDRDEYIGAHPRYPKLKRFIQAPFNNAGVFTTALTFDSSFDGYTVNAEIGRAHV